MNMYFWNPVFSFEIPGPAHIILLILTTLHQQWPPRQHNNVLYKSLLEENLENCALSSMVRQLGCQSVTRAIIRKHASFPVTTSPDEQHKWGSHSDIINNSRSDFSQIVPNRVKCRNYIHTIDYIHSISPKSTLHSVHLSFSIMTWSRERYLHPWDLPSEASWHHLFSLNVDKYGADTAV